MNSSDRSLARGALVRLQAERAQLVVRSRANEARRFRLFSAGEVAGEALDECNGEAFALAAALRDQDLAIAALRECLGGAATAITLVSRETRVDFEFAGYKSGCNTIQSKEERSNPGLSGSDGTGLLVRSDTKARHFDATGTWRSRLVARLALLVTGTLSGHRHEFPASGYPGFCRREAYAGSGSVLFSLFRNFRRGAGSPPHPSRARRAIAALGNGHEVGRETALLDELAAFDSLPATVRRLITDAPMQLSAVAIGEMVALHGEVAAGRCVPMIIRALSAAPPSTHRSADDRSAHPDFQMAGAS